MSRRPGPHSSVLLLAVCCALAAGCADNEQNAPRGSARQSTASAGNGAEGSGERRGDLPTASISAVAADEAVEKRDDPSAGEADAERLVQQILQLRVQPFPDTDDPDRLRAHRRWRNEKIVNLAREAIQLTHNDPKKERLFNVAVHHLMEARLELALLRGVEKETLQQYADALYADADALYQRDPNSKAAAEAAFIRAKFVNTSAQRFAHREPRWLEEFSRQARLFASNFPKEQARAVSLLDAAARSCELHRMAEEAALCYTQLRDRYPETPQGRQAAAALRRLLLKQTRLQQFGGPTIAGGYQQIDQFRGRVLLVVFWASHSREFARHVPVLRQLVETYGPEGFTILGVGLDEDASAAREFLQENAWMNPVLFWPQQDQRGWNNPIVRYYGIRDIPSYWLIDRDGIVVDPLVDPLTLEQKLPALLSKE